LTGELAENEPDPVSPLVIGERDTRLGVVRHAIDLHWRHSPRQPTASSGCGAPRSTPPRRSRASTSALIPSSKARLFDLRQL